MFKEDQEYEIIFVKWFRHRKTGKIIHAKGKAIPLRIRRN